MKFTQFDRSVRPQDDFFGYVNNDWIRHNPIPPTESSWGTFYELRDNATDAVRRILDDIATSSTPLTHDERLLKTFYATAQQFSQFSSAHYASLQTIADEINALNSPTDVARFLGTMQRRGQSGLWSLYVDHDDKNSERYVLRFHQSGLTLPNRDYYLDDTPAMHTIRTAYQDFFAAMHSHMPSIVPDDWQTVYDIETTIATASWTTVQLRDIAQNYHPFTLASLADTFAFAWDVYFDACGWTQRSDNIVVSQPSFVLAMCDLLAHRPLDDIKTYLRWRLLHGFYSWIDEQAARHAFDFFGTALTGATEMKPLWKRAVQSIDSLIIGWAVGKTYAQRYFPESSKTAVLSMVEDIRAAYHARLERVAWMSAATKQRAHTKLDNIRVFIGYPDKWKDLSPLTLTPDNHLENLIRIRTFDMALELKKIGQKPDTEEWEMFPQTVNAYHHPNRLEIVFPAAILQPPFYDPTASYATNLGGIGAVIGHEFTHGFDDQGADFDEHGNTHRWQTPAERNAFDALAANIVAQADAFETAPGVYLKGKLVLGEAIADIGGLELALEAFRINVPEADQPSEIKNLFHTFARAECGHTTEARAIELAKVDPHPPSRFRVNCVVCHSDTFYTTYALQPTDKLYLPPKKRAQIW